MRTATLRILSAFGVATVLVLTQPNVSSAHIGLSRSVPARESRLTLAPRELRLTFTETPELAVTRIALIGPDSSGVQLGKLREDSARTVVAAIEGALRAGRYAVHWQITGPDGHPVRGEFWFVIAEGASGLASRASPGEAGGAFTPPGQAPVPEAHHPSIQPTLSAESPAYVAIRWALFTSLLVVLGALAFQLGVLARINRSSGAWRRNGVSAIASFNAARLGILASAVLLVSALARLLVQSVAMHGIASALAPELIGAMLLRTMWGWSWLAQVAAGSIALASFVAARRGARIGWIVGSAAAIILAFTPALSGHAVGTERLTTVAILSDALHVLGAGGWLGSLLLVMTAGVPAALQARGRDRTAAVAQLVNAFHPTALAFASLTAATGIFAAWLHLDSQASVWTTDYGRVLLAKLAVLLVVAGIGAYNASRVRPALSDETGTRRLERTARAELAVGLVVVALTAVLVATPPPSDQRNMPSEAASR